MAAEEFTDIQPTEKKPFHKWLAFIVVVGLVSAVLYSYSGSQRTAVDTKAQDDKLAVMEVRLQNLENGTALYADRLTKLEKSAEAGEKTAAASVSTPAVVTTEPSVASPPLVTAPLSGDEAKRIEALEKEITAMKSTVPLQDSEHVAHSIKLLSSFHRLSDKVLSGKPFSTELSAFEDNIGNNTVTGKPLSELTKYAEGGVPTLVDLIASFDNSADQLTTAQAVPPVEAGAWERFTFNITHLVRVRRVDGQQTGKDAASVVARASSHLDKGEIEAAFAEIDALPEDVRGNFTNWLEDAQVAINAPGIIDRLEEQVMGQVFSSTAKEAPVSAPIDNGLNIQ